MKYAHSGTRNWYTAMGVLFIIMAAIVLARNIIIWGPGFVLDFVINSEFTNEKLSLGMIAFGSYLIFLGVRKNRVST